MKHPLALLSLSALAAACIDVAHAQPVHPRPLPGPPVLSPAARSPHWVVQRGRGDWLATCVAGVGCAAPRAVVRCAPDAAAAALTFAQVVDQRFRLDGRAVTVRGRLSADAPCSEMACPSGACCNHCRGAVALAGTAASSLGQLALGVADDEAFACRGDDSGLCCGTALVAGDVVARGVLRPVAGSNGAWRIESPVLCATE